MVFIKCIILAVDNQYDSWHIGLATSSDGINWTKLQNPVLYAGVGWEYQIAVSSVLKVDNHIFHVLFRWN